MYLNKRPLLHMCTCDIIDHQYILSRQNCCFLSLQGPKVKQADVGKFVELPGAEKGKVGRGEVPSRGIGVSGMGRGRDGWHVLVCVLLKSSGYPMVIRL